jgi:hypothetical protein
MAVWNIYQGEELIASISTDLVPLPETYLRIGPFHLVEKYKQLWGVKAIGQWSSVYVKEVVYDFTNSSNHSYIVRVQ